LDDKGDDQLRDRFTRGFLAGIIAAVPSLLFALIAFWLNWTTLRWATFAAILIYGRRSLNLAEEVFSTLAVFMLCGIFGIIFVFLIPKLTSVNLLLKSWVFGVTIWFLAFVATLLFKVPGLLIIPFKTVVINLIQATIWGLLLGYCLSWLENRLKT